MISCGIPMIIILLNRSSLFTKSNAALRSRLARTYKLFSSSALEIIDWIFSAAVTVLRPSLKPC